MRNEKRERERERTETKRMKENEKDISPYLLFLSHFVYPSDLP